MTDYYPQKTDNFITIIRYHFPKLNDHIIRIVRHDTLTQSCSYTVCDADPTFNQHWVIVPNAAMKMRHPCKHETMLGWYWPTVSDVGSTSTQHWFNASCFLGYMYRSLQLNHKPKTKRDPTKCKNRIGWYWRCKKTGIVHGNFTVDIISCFICFHLRDYDDTSKQRADPVCTGWTIAIPPQNTTDDNQELRFCVLFQLIEWDQNHIYDRSYNSCVGYSQAHWISKRTLLWKFTPVLNKAIVVCLLQEIFLQKEKHEELPCFYVLSRKQAPLARISEHISRTANPNNSWFCM